MSNTRDPLGAVNEDIQRIAHDVEQLAEDIEEESRLVGEELVGAELVATKEMTQNIGILWDAAERLNNIGAEQLSLLFDDWRIMGQELLEMRGPADYAATLMRYWRRRAEHVSEGVSAAMRVVTQETNLLESAMFGVWNPFFAVVSRDWGRRDADAAR